MRTLAIAMMIAATAGCSSNGDSLPTNTRLTDAGVNLDGHLETSDPGATGTSCSNGCDCQPGLACLAGKCGAAANPYYCCESTTCPASAQCQSMNGTYSTCGAGPGGTGTGPAGPTGPMPPGGTGGLPGGISIGDLLGDGGLLSGLGSGLGGISLPGGGGGIPGLGGDGGIGIPGSGGGGIPDYCSFFPCSKDSDCSFGCTKCNGGKCSM